VAMLSSQESGSPFEWQPNVELCRSKDVGRYELLYDEPHVEVAKDIGRRIELECPQTKVGLHRIDLGRDPWDLEGVYLGLDEFARQYPWNPEEEDYFVHAVRGTFVMRICFFLLVESRRIPAKLVHNTPPTANKARGEWREVDLSLARYDRIAARFHSMAQDAVSALKRGIQTRNENFNRLISQIERVAVNTTEPILLLGPTGAGKSDLAERIYFY
jgi:transcriptional regulatory protein RtcR